MIARRAATSPISQDYSRCDVSNPSTQARPETTCVTDSTRHVELAALRRRIDALERELLACQRKAMLGNIAAMVAHEFNNLLTPVIARSEAAMNLGDAAFSQKTHERSLTQAQRAIEVARNLLAFARDEEHSIEPCSVAEAVQEAVDTLARPLSKDGIELSIDVPANLLVRAQPDLFCQLLMNLLLNARAAMKEQRGPLSVTAAEEDDHVAIAVRDSGSGFPDGVIEQRVNPFLAADPNENPDDWHAVGMGLSVCRMIAHKHNARLHVSDNDGPGCTFHVRWPAART